MAKKKKSIKGNSLRAILDFITLALGSVVLGFMALPHEAFKGSAGSHVLNAGSYSGFDLISFERGKNIGVSVILLLLAIFASCLIVSSLLKLVVDMGVVKNSLIAKIASFGTVVSAIAVAGLSVATCVAIPVAVSGQSGEILVVEGGKYAVWGSIIVNAILGVGSMITALFSARK